MRQRPAHRKCPEPHSPSRMSVEAGVFAYDENTQTGGRIQMLCHDLDGNTPEFQPATV